jgi:drug/metabolite transporter (DMT)-like permease
MTPPVSAADSNHTKGLALTALGGLTLTVDIPLIRLADGDHWSILFLRSATTLVATLLLWLIWRAIRGDVPKLVPGRSGLVVAALYGIGSITFVSAVFNTSTANLVFILAFNTMFAGLLSWIFLKERPRPMTFAATAAMLFGVLIIVSDGIGTGNFLGDMLALASAFLMACAITITRASGKDMGFTALVAVILPLVVAAAMVHKNGYHVEVPWWIIFNGAVVMPISFFCLATGPKYISAPEVAMFYLLETVLAPIWVWMIFSEVPSRNSMIGGAVLIVALAVHSLWQLSKSRRRDTEQIVTHPA